MNKSPCKDCNDRFIGCHSVCDLYIQFHKERLELYKHRAKDSDMDAYHYKKTKEIFKWLKHHSR